MARSSKSRRSRAKAAKTSATRCTTTSPSIRMHIARRRPKIWPLTCASGKGRRAAPQAHPSSRRSKPYTGCRRTPSMRRPYESSWRPRTMRSVIADSRRLVVKVGSSLVTNDGRGLDHTAIGRWAAQIAALREQGKEVVLVSSGAIAEGMQRLGWTRRPREIDELQAAAAVGQMGLAQVYESRFAKHSIQTAQILLTHADLADRERYLNARSTLLTLLRLGCVPVINENDTVVTEEIRFGDN